MALGRRDREEQSERMRERTKLMVEALAQWGACADAAIAKAKISLEALRKSLAKSRL